MDDLLGQLQERKKLGDVIVCLRVSKKGEQAEFEYESGKTVGPIGREYWGPDANDMGIKELWNVIYSADAMPISLEAMTLMLKDADSLNAEVGQAILRNRATV